MDDIVAVQNIFTTILETIYYLSSVGVLIVAIIGLKQLKIAKNSLIIRSRREAGALANEQSKHYIEDIIPMIDMLDEFLNKKGFEKYKGNISTYSNKDLLEYSESWYLKWLRLNLKEQPSLKALNALDGFASFFTSKIADEGIAFRSVGITYCNTVESLYPYIACVREDENFGHYNNIVDLHKIWQPRIDKFQMEKNLNDLQGRINKIEDSKIDPIGTK